jgi:hypothetical protein
MATCSRCGCREPNPECFVCTEPNEEEDTYPDDEEASDSALDRLLDRADYLRDKQRDDAWEDAMEARGEGEEEERKLGTRED